MAIYKAGQRRRGSGLMMPGIAGQVLFRGDAIYLAGDGMWYPAEADVAATMPVVAVTAERCAVAGQIVQIVLQGLVGRGDWAWNRGAQLYLSTAPGALTESAPAAPSFIQPVATAITSTLIYVNPHLGGESLSMIDYEVQTGIIAEPTIPPRGNGHMVIVLYTMYAPDRVVTWKYANGGWYGSEAL